MELWIRSQDKTELLKVFNVYVENCWVRANFESEYISADLGKYATKERALEVLDEIQGLFVKQEPEKTEFTKDGLTVYAKQPNSIVYEMPQE